LTLFFCVHKNDIVKANDTQALIYHLQLDAFFGLPNNVLMFLLSLILVMCGFTWHRRCK